MGIDRSMAIFRVVLVLLREALVHAFSCFSQTSRSAELEDVERWFESHVSTILHDYLFALETGRFCNARFLTMSLVT